MWCNYSTMTFCQRCFSYAAVMLWMGNMDMVIICLDYGISLFGTKPLPKPRMISNQSHPA